MKLDKIIVTLNNPISTNATVLKAKNPIDEYIYMGYYEGQNNRIQKSGVGTNFNVIA